MITVIIPAYNEAKNISSVLVKTNHVLNDIAEENEIIVIDAGSTDATQKISAELGAKVLVQKKPGYGAALKEGFEKAKGDYIITLDADFSHDPLFIKEMWKKKEAADLIIASRYIREGKSDASWERKLLSIILNKFFSFALSLPAKDLSSGFRMYKKAVIQELRCEADGYNFLIELLVRIYGNGWRVMEVPFHYLARKKGKSHIKLLKFGISYFSTLFKMWQLRNSIFFADYDERAFNSRIPIQRFWQRRRFSIIMGFLQDSSEILDIGCGTSKIILNLPQAVGMDIEIFKLRYLFQKGKRKLVKADIKELPFKDSSFKTVICSEVIEHVEKNQKNFQEMLRVLKPQGELIIGTPDYGRVSWLIIEWLYKKILPNAYGQGHISHYTYEELVASLELEGFSILGNRYILSSEFILRAKKLTTFKISHLKGVLQ